MIWPPIRQKEAHEAPPFIAHDMLGLLEHIRFFQSWLKPAKQEENDHEKDDGADDAPAPLPSRKSGYSAS